MKTSKTQKNTTSNSHSSKPFFNKSGEGSFFSPTNENEKPSFSPSSVQSKLTVGQPNDKYEQEADMMAEKVVKKTESPNSNVPIQRKYEDSEQEDKLQKKEEDTEEMQVMRKPVFDSGDDSQIQTKSIESQLNTFKGKGSSLPKNPKSNMESVFGADFSSVKLHTDAESVQMNQKLNAKAFTHGSDVYFNRGQYNPGSSEGKRLLGHELTHVVQQGGGASVGLQKAPTPSSRQLTRESAGLSASPVRLRTTPRVERSPMGFECGSTQNAVSEQIRSNVDLVVQRAPKNPLKGRKTREVIDAGIAPVIDNVLRESSFLRPYIKGKLKTGRKISGNFKAVGPAHFKDLYISHAISRGVTVSKAKKDQPNVVGFYDPAKDRIVMPVGSANVGGALHEAIHFFAEPKFRSWFTGPVDEGVTQFYTNFVLSEFGLKDSPAYPDEYLNGLSLVFIVGREALGKAYFVPGHAMILFEALSNMYLEEHKVEWLQYLGRRDFVALSGIPHRPRPEDK